jgi:perosamine synthetase
MCGFEDTKMIPLFSTHIPNDTAQAVFNLIKSGWINRGKKAEEFEDLFKIKFGYGYALSVNSCTSALRMAYDIANYYGQGKNEVITTPYTMIATNTAILECKLKPIFVDVEYETGNIDVDKVLDVVDGRTLAIVGVDYAGYPCDWRELKTISSDYDVALIDDAAHALGAKISGFSTGMYADMACYSFQAVKHINTGDGGMFVCGDPEIYELAKKKIWFGIDKSKRVQTPLGTYPKDVDILGFKYGMNDINAVMGIEGLKDFDEVFKRRREIAKCYSDVLQGVPEIELMDYSDKSKVHANWLFPIHVENRLKFAEYMRIKEIEVAVHNWRNDSYSIFGKKRKLPQTARLNNDLIHIPLHAELSDSEVIYIAKTIREWKK